MLLWIKYQLTHSLLFCVLAVACFSSAAAVYIVGLTYWIWFGDAFYLDMNKWLPVAVFAPFVIAPFPTVSLFQKFRQLNRALIEAGSQVRHLAITDALTGAHNRRFLMDEAPALLAQCHRDQPLSAVLIDIDHFKSFNDRWGHIFGDRVLVQVATCLCRNLPDGGLLVRYGGEEFVAILPAAPYAQALLWAEKARVAVAMIVPITTDGDRANVSISLGVVSNHSHTSLDAMLDQADHCLYAAKRSGRNRVIGSADLGALREIGQPAIEPIAVQKDESLSVIPVATRIAERDAH